MTTRTHLLALAFACGLVACDCGTAEQAADEANRAEQASEAHAPIPAGQLGARAPVYQRPLSRPLADAQALSGGRFALMSAVVELAVVDADFHVYASERLGTRREHTALMAADGEFIVVSSGEVVSTLRAWDLSTRRWSHLADIHPEDPAQLRVPVTGLALRGSRVAVLSDAGLLVGTLSEGLGEPSEVPAADALAFSGDGARIYGLSSEASWVRDFGGGEVISAATGLIHLVAPHASGTLVASAEDTQLTLHESETLTARATATTAFEIVRLCASFDGAYVFAQGADDLQSVVDAASGETVELAALTEPQRALATRVGCARQYLSDRPDRELILGGERSLWGAAIAADGASAVTYGRSDWVRWSRQGAQARQCGGLSTMRYLTAPQLWVGVTPSLTCIPGQEPKGVRPLFWSEDGRRMVGLASRPRGQNEGTIGLGILSMLGGQSEPLDGQDSQLIVAELEGIGDEVRWSEVRLESEGCPLERHCDRLMDLSRDGARVLAPVGDELQVLDASLRITARVAAEGAGRAGFSPDAAWVAVTSDERLRLHDARDGSERWRVDWNPPDAERRNMRFEFSDDGASLAVVRGDELHIFAVDSGERRGQLNLEGALTSAFWWASPERLMRMSEQTLVVHDRSAQLVSTMAGVLGVSDDGTHIATCEGGVLHVHQGEAVRAMSAECFEQDVAQFSEDGERLLLARRAYALVCRPTDGGCVELHRYTQDMSSITLAADHDGRVWLEPASASEHFMKPGELYADPMQPLAQTTPGLLGEYFTGGP